MIFVPSLAFIVYLFILFISRRDRWVNLAILVISFYWIVLEFNKLEIYI